MTTLFSFRYKFLALTLLCSLGLVFSQCSKPETKGVITVKNLATGQSLQGVTVTLTTDTAKADGFFTKDDGFIPEKVYTTNSSGVINETFELPALITVTAVLVTDTATLTGSGKLNLVEHETTNLEIKMN